MKHPRVAFAMILLLCAAALLAPPGSARAQAPGAQPEPRAGAHGLMLPGSFMGDLPAASGPGIRHVLDLWPDQVFQLRRSWIGTTTEEDMLGRWHVDPDRRALVLTAAGGQAPAFEILGNGNLRLLDQDGKRIESALPYTLSRADSFAPFTPKLALRGMFLYFADAARLTECVSGRSWPVAMEGDFVALQRAYLAGRQAPQTPVMARVEARIAERPRMEGDDTMATVVVDRFVSVHPGEGCDRPAPATTLRNTYWRIVSIGGTTLATAPGRREASLLLSGEAQRFAATVGCNQMIGGVETTATTLRFQSGPSTMMACPPPLDAAERALGALLRETASYRLDGTRLALLAADGRPLARLEAVYLR
ncbi:META domain-containing protein [Elioraea sp.]|uniref:META domain-containing protein n=1 Tax=Elioraea sp. TaxID=2185103 RepID=UPI0025C04809|nr:META domain-containing protein [Elioraea sp.]